LDLKKIHSFSIGFEGDYDETPQINLIKNKFQTKHHYKYFKEKDFKEFLEKIFYYYDEPHADVSQTPTFMLSKITKKNVGVALSGDGGDEIFGGYLHYVQAARIIFIKKLPKIIRQLLKTNIRQQEFW